MKLTGWIRRLTIDTWRAIDEEWIEKGRERFDWRPLVVLVVVCISLTLQEYYGDRGKFWQYWPELRGTHYGELKSYAWWSGWRFLGYVVLPVMVILAMPGERLRDYFIRPKDFLRHLWIYVGLFLLAISNREAGSPKRSLHERWESAGRR